MVMFFCLCEFLLPTMSLDIMFLTNDNLHRLRKEPPVLGLRYRGLANGIENDQNTTNIPDLSHTRLSITSTTSNQSYDSNVDYAVPKHTFNQRGHHDDYQKHNDYQKASDFGQKVSNPLFGVNAASQYNPAAIEDKYAIPNGVRKAPEGQDNEAFKEDTVDGRKEVTNQIAIADGGTATYTTDNNGKINVHVTVMINAGTLADLKKQRAQIRTNGSPVESAVHSPNTHSLNSIPEDAKEEKPQVLSPSTTVPRFSGNTSDVVGDTKSRRCCIIM